MNHADAFRRCLEHCDIAGIRKLWAHVQPNLPQPASDDEALATIHHARTQTPNIALRLRAYSHRWLLDHDLPSALPDGLKPKAERMYPKIVGAVGISALIQRPYTPIVQGAMRDAVAECYEDRRTEPAFVKARMMEARDKERKKLWLDP